MSQKLPTSHGLEISVGGVVAATTPAPTDDRCENDKTFTKQIEGRASTGDIQFTIRIRIEEIDAAGAASSTIEPNTFVPNGHRGETVSAVIVNAFAQIELDTQRFCYDGPGRRRSGPATNSTTNSSPSTPVRSPCRWSPSTIDSLRMSRMWPSPSTATSELARWQIRTSRSWSRVSSTIRWRLGNHHLPESRCWSPSTPRSKTTSS
jgi:hypothetical protein